jgi:hypothetical protein
MVLGIGLSDVSNNGLHLMLQDLEAHQDQYYSNLLVTCLFFFAKSYYCMLMTWDKAIWHLNLDALQFLCELHYSSIQCCYGAD